MATLRTVPLRVRATYHAFMTHRQGAPIPDTDLHFGQGVKFRGKAWTVSGSDGKGAGTTVRLINEGITRELLMVQREELSRF